MPGKSANVKSQPDAPLWLSVIVLVVLLAAGLTLRLAYMNGHYFVPLAGNYISLIAGILAVIPIAMLARRLGGSVAMWTAVGLYLFNAKFLPWMTSDTPEPLMTLLLSLALVSSIVTLNKPGVLSAFLTGVILGACWIFRVETFFFIPAYGIFLAIVLLEHKVPSGTITKIAISILVGWMVFAVPMMVYLHGSGGDWMPGVGSDSTFKSFANSLEPRKDLIPPYESEFLQQSAIVTGTFVENIIRVKRYGLGILKWWGIGLAFIGAMTLLFTREKRLMLGPIGAAIVPIFVMGGFGISERMLIPYMAIAQIIAGVGLARLAGGGGVFIKGFQNGPRRTGAYLIIAGLILSGLALHAKHSLMISMSPGDLPYEHRAMAYYIRDNLPEIGKAGGPAVASHLPWVEYYSNIGSFKWLPVVDSVDELRDKAMQQNIGWVVIDARTVYRYNPSLAPLIDYRNAPDWLVPVVSLPSTNPIVLYEVKAE